MKELSPADASALRPRVATLTSVDDDVVNLWPLTHVLFMAGGKLLPGHFASLKTASIS